MPLESQMKIQAETKRWWPGTLGWRLVGWGVGVEAIAHDGVWLLCLRLEPRQIEACPAWNEYQITFCCCTKWWQRSKMIYPGCPKYILKQQCPMLCKNRRWRVSQVAAQSCLHCGLHHTLYLNSSAQPIATYFLILGCRANATVKLGLPKEEGKKNVFEEDLWELTVFQALECVSYAPSFLNFIFLPSGRAIIFNTQVMNLVLSGINYLALCHTATLEAELLFKSSPFKI